MAILIEFACDRALFARVGAVDDAVELLCSPVVVRVDFFLSSLGYLTRDCAVGVVARGGGQRLEVDEVVSSTEFGSR